MLNQENIFLLQRFTQIIEALDDSQYTHTDPALYNSSIGAHVRHVLDHYQAFVLGHTAGHINYDQRAREQRLEVNRSEASARIKSLIEALLPIDNFEQSISVTMDTKLDAGPISAAEASAASNSPVVAEANPQLSSVGRELAFLHSHSIHHQALVGFILRALKVAPPPDDFGVAPATLRHREASRCAP